MRDRELEIVRLRQQVIAMEVRLRKKELRASTYKETINKIQEQHAERRRELEKTIKELRAANWALTMALDQARGGQG